MGLSVPVDPALARSIYNPPALGFTPPSAPWLSDTLNGLDLYKLGFGLTPTIYFDPAANETSRNLGTYQNPYTTSAQVQARCAGFMGGQVLGIKRGGLVRGTLSLSCYGSSGAPFVIAPYGDALAMPIFSGGVVRTGWTAYSGDARIWQLGGIAQAVDVFEHGERLFAVTGANLAAKIAAIQAFITAPIAGTPGVFALDGTTLYAWFQDGASPNLGQVETAEAANAIAISYPDVAGTGYVTLAGMTGMMTRSSAVSLTPANASGTHAPSALQVVACQAGRAGAQLDTSVSADGFQVYGIDDAHRVSGCYLAGNYAFDTLNNAFEVAAISSCVLERNIGWNAGGSSVAELWALCSDLTVQFNRGYNDPLASQRLSSSYHNGGIWRTNYSTVTGSASDDTKSGGNVVRFNYIQDPGNNGLDVLGGAGDSYYNNTVVAARQGWGNGWYVRGADASGHSLTNNLFVNAAPGAGFVFFGQIDAGVATPSLDGNAYANLTNATGSGGAWRGGPTQYYDIGSWRAFTGGEAHSRATLGDATGAAFGFSGAPLSVLVASAGYGGAADYALSGSIVQGAGQALPPGAPLCDIEGRAILNPASPDAGCRQDEGP
jgi:hypothetical protein